MKNAASKDVLGADTANASQNSQSSSAGDSVEKQFLDYAHMNPIDRMRAGILKSMGLTEDSLKNLPPDQRQAVEAKIKQMVEQEFQKNAGKTGQLIDVSA